MKITLIPSGCTDAAVTSLQYLTSFLVNDRVAFDAGALGFYKTPADQALIRHVFLSHSHIDHVGSLPIFLDNIFGMTASPITVYGNEAVQHSLRADIFNGRVWPNFLDMLQGENRFVEAHRMESGDSVEVESLRVTAAAVDHTVPTLGYIVQDAKAAVVIAADTGPTEAIWEAARNVPNLKAIFLEATFPDALADLAHHTKHLTPASFVAEMSKMPSGVTIYAVHLRARYRDPVVRELQAHRLPNLQIAKFGASYEF